ncbi:tetratricopeptide repeat protein [Leptolyngbya sp. 7M]|uniref:tetratricopeptide repeat protein n=1 Tax=Leptolyngbya sp. 7M TaxID=2812896 RepID=UPI001B8CA86D|nr:hypothetical protein [Leptolyngbya sp. 7M]QYO62906.1 hypothetical protein JVX88_23230 [Leptolyngbya sp. 7M]
MRMILLAFAAVVLYMVAITTEAQRITETTRIDELAVQLNQNTFFLLEPIYVKFKVPMPDKGVTLPRVSQDVTVEVTLEGKTTRFQGLTSAVTMGGTISLPNQLEPSKFEEVEKYQLIDRTLELFPSPGDYQVRFFLNGHSSKSVPITILEPVGEDKQAHDFLVLRKDGASFGWIWDTPDGIGLLEQFVHDYGRTVYGDFAIQKLANVYLARGDVENARFQFNRLALSKRSYIADDAHKRLSEINALRTSNNW